MEINSDLLEKYEWSLESRKKFMERLMHIKYFNQERIEMSDTDTVETVDPEMTVEQIIEIFKGFLHLEGLEAASNFLERTYGGSIPAEVKPELKGLVVSHFKEVIDAGGMQAASDFLEETYWDII